MVSNKKRFASLILALVMVFSLLPTGLVRAEAMETPKEIAPTAYEEADLIFDQLDAAEDAPDKRNTTTAQKVEAAIEIVLASDSYVEGSLEQNGNSFTWWTDDGIRCVYSPRMREIDEARTPETACDEIVNEPVAHKGGSPTGNQVYLIGPYYGSDSSFTDQYKKEAKRVAESIGDTDGYTLYSGKSATVDKVAEAVSNGAVVFFDSHGMTDYENPNNEYDCSTGATYSYLCLTSTTGLTDEDYDDGALYYSDGICINGATIANHMTKNSPSGFLWMAICLGMATNTICEPLREMGVEVVYGYSESVTFEGDYRFEETFWETFLNGDTVASAISKMKAKWGDYDWSTQIANDYGSYDGYTTLREAQQDFTAFPVVVSDEDAFPGKRTTSSYGASTLQTVKSTYTLFTACDHVWSEATCTAAATCTLCGRVNGKPAPHTDNNGDVLCDVCGKDLSVTPNTYVKVTETPNDWSGQYLIVWEAGNLAFNGALTTFDSVNNGFDVTIEDDTIVLDEADADKYFVIAPNGNWYTVQSASGYYIGNTSGSNKIQYSNNADYIHDLTMDADGSVLIEADDYSVLRFNKTSGQMRFRFYKSASYSSQEPVALYKLVEGGTSGGCKHSYDAGVTTTKPTCTSEGVMTYTCALCGDIQTETVPALGHSFVDGTCENCGLEESGGSGEESGGVVTSGTASTTIADYADANSWVSTTKYSTITLDDHITITATGGANTGKYYSNGENWRLYQSESAEIGISGNDDSVVITSVKITYLSYNGGVLILDDVHIASDETVAVNGNSVNIYVGNMGSANNGQARITGIEVTYTVTADEEEPTDPTDPTDPTETEPTTPSEPTTAEDPNAKFAQTGLALGEFIGLQNAIMKSALNSKDFDEAYFIYKHHTFDADGNAIVVDGQGEFIDMGSYFVADCKVNAKQMADVFEITPVYVKDGVTYYGVTAVTSVKEQAMVKVNSTATDDKSVKTAAICVAMLNYGAKAQEQFNYNANDLANSDLNTEQKTLPAFADLNLVKTNTIPTTPFKPAQSGMQLGDVVYMQFLVAKSNVDAAGVLTYTIGSEAAVEIAVADLEVYSNNYYLINIPIKAKNVRTDISVSFTAENYTMTCSIEAFAVAKEGTATETLVAALMAYGDATAALFG